MTATRTFKLILGSLLCFSLLSGRTAQATQESHGDPSTIVATADYAKWTKDYTGIHFDVLSSFPYPFPGPGKQLSDRKVVPPPAVQTLDKKKVAIKGYMLPVDIDGNGVSTFLLQADLQTCCFGIHGDPNTYIWVTMAKKTQFSFFNPITVYGTFHVGEIAEGPLVEDIESFYQMDGVAIAVHTPAFDKAVSSAGK